MFGFEKGTGPGPEYASLADDSCPRLPESWIDPAGAAGLWHTTARVNRTAHYPPGAMTSGRLQLLHGAHREPIP